MKAFTQGITKQEFLTEIYKHRDMDAFIKGTYSEGEGKHFQGCAVGCSLESVARLKKIKVRHSDHSEYEKHLGIPQWVARLEDRIFEGVLKERSKTWPVEFAEAVNEGADLNKIKIPFLIFIVEQARTKTTNERSLKAIDGVLTELRKDVLDLDLLREARRAAADAAVDAAYTAAAAAYTAAAAAYAAAAAAADAADAAAAAAADAADAAYTAAAAADAAAAAAAAAYTAAARSNAFGIFADKLLELMRGCN